MNHDLAFKKILSTIELNTIDAYVIRFSRLIGAYFNTSVIRFIHIMPRFDFQKYFGASHEELIKLELPSRHQIESDIYEEVRQTINHMESPEIEIRVIEGEKQAQLFKEIERYKPDLILIGKSKKSDHPDIIARRMARKVESAIFFIPEKSKTEIKRILVPVDFSNTSARALMASMQLLKTINNVQITVLHVIPLPSTAYRINKNAAEITAHLKHMAYKNFIAFQESHGIKEAAIKFISVLNEHFNTAKHIQEIGMIEKADVIVIGAKGHSLFEDIVFGSVTEKLVAHENRIPVLVIR